MESTPLRTNNADSGYAFFASMYTNTNRDDSVYNQIAFEFIGDDSKRAKKVDKMLA